jgi:hypothetical protein
MLASGKQPQHARCVRCIGGLAEKFAIDDNHGVRAEHDIVIIRTLTGDGERLLARQAFGAGFRGFSGLRVFGDMRGLHFECDSCVAQ